MFAPINYYTYHKEHPGNTNVTVAPPPNPKLQNAHLRGMFEQIDQVANEDIEMQAPSSEFAIFLIVDTNIFLHHFEFQVQLFMNLMVIRIAMKWHGLHAELLLGF